MNRLSNENSFERKFSFELTLFRLFLRKPLEQVITSSFVVENDFNEIVD